LSHNTGDVQGAKIAKISGLLFLIEKLKKLKFSDIETCINNLKGTR